MTANTDVAVARKAAEPMATTSQLLVEIVEHEITEEGRERLTLRGPSSTGLIRPSSSTRAFRNARMRSTKSPSAVNSLPQSEIPVCSNCGDTMRRIAAGS